MAVSRGKSYTKSRIRIVELPEYKCKGILVSTNTVSFAIMPEISGSGDLEYGMWYFNERNGGKRNEGLRLPTMDEAQAMLDNMDKINKLLLELGEPPLNALPFWIGETPPDGKNGYILRFNEITTCIKTRVVTYQCVVDF